MEIAAEKPADVSAALRHAVYRDLLCFLPIASKRQTERFASNLALCRNRRSWKVLQKLLRLRVSPEIAEATRYKKLSRIDIEILIAAKYGDRLKDVAGFYFNDRWRLNLPRNSAFIEYRNAHGYNRGILCQPLYSADNYFLLSSVKFGGPRALRMERFDQEFFESYKEPVFT